MQVRRSVTTRIAEPKKQTRHRKRPADLIQQKFHIKHRRLAVDQNRVAVHAVDDHAVQLRYEKLEIIYENQRCKTENQNGRILQVVFVNVLSKYHIFSPSFCFCHCLL